jgi:hypothetical protein
MLFWKSSKFMVGTKSKPLLPRSAGVVGESVSSAEVDECWPIVLLFPKLKRPFSGLPTTEAFELAKKESVFDCERKERWLAEALLDSPRVERAGLVEDVLPNLHIMSIS